MINPVETQYSTTKTVTLLLGPLEKKSWYTELMTFLIALAMGTMFCVTIYQLIPEALELLHTVEYLVACETTLFQANGPSCETRFIMFV